MFISEELEISPPSNCRIPSLRTVNTQCTPTPSVKSINGVSANIVSFDRLPSTTYNNVNGNRNIVCNYSCSITSSQGGCNTADQVADYFFKQFGGTKLLLFHFTQYGYWNGTHKISESGNCCAVPILTSVIDNLVEKTTIIFPNPSNGVFSLKSETKISKTQQKQLPQ